MAGGESAEIHGRAPGRVPWWVITVVVALTLGVLEWLRVRGTLPPAFRS